MLTSRRTPTNPQSLVPSSSHIASEGLQVGVSVPDHSRLVSGRLVLVKHPQILEALGTVAREIPQRFGGSVRCPLCIPWGHLAAAVPFCGVTVNGFNILRRAHAPLQARAYRVGIGNKHS